MPQKPSRVQDSQPLYQVHLVDQPTTRERWVSREYDITGRVLRDTAGERVVTPPTVRWPGEPGPIGRFARRAWHFFVDWLTAAMFLAGVVGAVVIGFTISEHLTGSGWPGLAITIALGAALCASGMASHQ